MSTPDLVGLRVLAFCDYFGASSSGGAERVAAETYARLSEWGANVRIVSGCPPRLMVDGVESGYSVRRARSIELTRLVGAQVALAPALGRLIRREVATFRPTVLHAHGLHFQGSVLAARLAGRTGLPLVTTAHLAGPEHLSTAVRLPTSVYERSVGRYVLSRSCRVIAVSKAVAKHVASLGTPHSLITVVPNGVDHRRFHPDPNPRHNDPPVICFLGRLIGNKGPELFVDAMELLRARGIAFSAEFVGDGPLRDRLEASLRATGLDGVARVIGNVDDVAGTLRAVDIVVRPSTTEGMPLTVLEAMATAVCVVASDVDGNVELVTDGVTGLTFPVGDAKAFADALSRVLGDQGLRRRLAAAGHQLALSHSWEATAAMTAELLVAAAGLPV